MSQARQRGGVREDEVLVPQFAQRDLSSPGERVAVRHGHGDALDSEVNTDKIGWQR